MLRLCKACKTAVAATDEDLEALRHQYGPEWFETHGVAQLLLKPLLLYHPVGCRECHQLGYRGRIAVHELLRGTEAIKKAIRRNADAHEIQAIALAEGMTTLKMDGVLKVIQGLSDLKHLAAVTN